MRELKFIHCADIHLNAPFKENRNENYAETRRGDIKNSFLKILNRVKDTNSDLLLISGDLYEHHFITRKTMDWLNAVLSQVKVPVIIIPGNHDPYIQNSWYRAWEWPDNVHILSPDKPHILLEELKVSIYGIGFSAFREDKPDLSVVPAPLKGYFNILMLHGTLDMDFTEQAYKPVTTQELKALNYDYYALGHFHKTKIIDNIANPGSPEPLGFDEKGSHGAFLVRLSESQGEVKVESHFFETACREYCEKTIDVSGCRTLEEIKIRILEVVEGLNYNRHLIRVTLKGRTELSIDTEYLKDMFSDWLYFDIRNESTKAFDIDSLLKNPSLKGAFAREMLIRLESLEKLLKNDPENENLKREKEVLDLALTFGLEALENGKLEIWGDFGQ
ncbi:MAG: DNA repair exonuclease [Clostridiaceae bacterium]|nr:DNA repair exonuclease [Clostridiaceae bacterium]